MGRKKIEKTEINELKTEEIVPEDTNTPIEEENALVEEGVKIDAENPDVEQDEKEEEKAINKTEVKEDDLITPEEVIAEATAELDEIKDEPTALSNFIFLLEEIINSNQDVDFDILNLKNQIRNLIAEFK